MRSWNSQKILVIIQFGKYNCAVSNFDTNDSYLLINWVLKLTILREQRFHRQNAIIIVIVERAGASFQLFLGGGGEILFLFFNATGLLKNWKKQHSICSNLTIFIVPFFLFSLFFSFFSLFSFFSFFFSFFFFLGGGGGDGPPSPPQMTPLGTSTVPG